MSNYDPGLAAKDEVAHEKLLMSSDSAPPPSPTTCGKIVATFFGVVLAMLIMGSQLNFVLETLIGLFCTVLLLPSLHLLDSRSTRPTRETNVTATMFLGPVAATFFNTLLLCLIALNSLWAARWLFGVEFVINDIYGVNATDVDTLRDCASTGSILDSFGARCDSPIATFLARPWALYWHASGAITTLVVGPFQLSIPFRRKYPVIHKRLGYLYCCGVVVGGFGSWPLIYYSSSGVVAGAGFFLLSIMWFVSLSIAMRSLLVLRDIRLHRKWMTRNYYLTFAAVPFRFLPLLTDLLSGFNLGQTAYGIGGWLTLMSVIVPGELYIRKFESYEKTGEESLRDVTISA